MLRSKRLATWSALALFALIVVVAGAATAADSDGDGIGDDLEKTLGTIPDAKEELQVIVVSENRGYSEEEAAMKPPDVLTIEACHVGGDRLLFKTTFAHEPDFSESIYQLYIDMDKKEETGRQDKGFAKGIDIMIPFVKNQLVSSPRDPKYNDAMVVGAVDGKTAFIVLDKAPLTVEGDQVVFGFYALSQAPDDRSDVTKRQVMSIPYHKDRKAPEVKLYKKQNLK